MGYHAPNRTRLNLITLIALSVRKKEVAGKGWTDAGTRPAQNPDG